MSGSRSIQERPGLRTSKCSDDRPGCRPANDRESDGCRGHRRLFLPIRGPAERSEEPVRPPHHPEQAAEPPFPIFSNARCVPKLAPAMVCPPPHRLLVLPPAPPPSPPPYALSA